MIDDVLSLGASDYFVQRAFLVEVLAMDSLLRREYASPCRCRPSFMNNLAMQTPRDTSKSRKATRQTSVESDHVVRSPDTPE